MLTDGTQVAIFDPMTLELLAICRSYKTFKDYFKPTSRNKLFDDVKDKMIMSNKYNKEFLIKEHKETWQSQQAIIFKKVIAKKL